MTYEQTQLHRQMRKLAIFWVALWALVVSLLSFAPSDAGHSAHTKCADYATSPDRLQTNIGNFPVTLLQGALFFEARSHMQAVSTRGT